MMHVTHCIYYKDDAYAGGFPQNQFYFGQASITIHLFCSIRERGKADFALPLQIKQAGGQKELTARLYALLRRLRAARPAVCPLQSASP